MADVEVQETRGGCIRAKIAIPQEILDRYNPEDGDELEITVKDGYIYVEPVAVYPQKTLDRWERDIEEMEALDAAGRLKHYTDIDEMFRDIGAKVPEEAEVPNVA